MQKKKIPPLTPCLFNMSSWKRSDYLHLQTLFHPIIHCESLDTSEPEVMHSDLVLEAETQDFHDDMELLLHCGIVGTVVSLHDIIVLLQNMVFHFSPHC